MTPPRRSPSTTRPTVAHDQQDAEEVKEKAYAHRQAVEDEAKAAQEKATEWAERDPKPRPSELLQERGSEPTPDTETSGENESSETSGADADAEQASEEPETQMGSDVPTGNMQEVLDWAGDDPDRIQQALNAERAGQNRSSLVTELERRQASA